MKRHPTEPRNRRTVSLGVTLAAALALAASAVSPAAAENGELCAPASESLNATRWLRATSLSIRGEVPTPAEYAAVAAAEDTRDAWLLEDTVAAIVDEWLVSDAFAERFVRLHRDLFWNNISDQPLQAVNVSLSAGNNTTTSWFRNGTMATRYRGRQVSCLNEPARFDDEGNVLTTTQTDGSQREGWVWVNPYWAPESQIRVCAFDAQDKLVSNNGVDCNSTAGQSEKDCGCGPNLRWCASGTQALQIARSFMEDAERRMRNIIKEDRSYLDLLTSKRGWVNGPIVHFLKYMSVQTRVRVMPVMTDVSQLPEIPFHETNTWVEVNLGDHHSGLLTSASYLLRFQTDRSRANRFYTAFLCQPFNPPAGGLPVADEASIHEPDLQLRAGCNYCHALLEPAAAHWARWGERGMTYLGADEFPAFDLTCATCARSTIPCPARCSTHYVVNPSSRSEETWTGWLTGYTFMRESSMRSIEEGPELLVHRSAVDGRLPRCVARTAAERLLGQELSYDTEDEAFIDELAQTFVASDFSYREIVREIVLNSMYRRVR
jgi:hypothetical protein